MPGPDTIPFRQADGNGHYLAKQLPDDQADFMEMLNLPTTGFGDVIGSGTSTPNQMPVYLDGTGKRITPFGGTGLVKTATGTVSTVTAPSGAVVGTTDVQTLTNKTLTSPVITGLTGLTKADVGLANVDNTSDVNKPVSTAQQTALNLKEDKANKGVNNGYASLDASGKVPASQLPSTGASVYQGTWNAATNTPTIPAAAAGNNGWYYNVNVAGTTNINGIASWAVGDQIISNGTVWQKIPNAQAVNSVNGYTGVVVLTKSDVGLGNVDNTSDATKNSAVATLTNKTLTSPAINSPTGLVKADVGLSNVDNTSDATKNTAVATLTNKTLSSPVINTPTGITKADVGLGNVDNTSDASKNSAAVTLTNKTINGAANTLTVRLGSDVTGNLPVANLGSGTGASATTWWRGDGVWASPSGSGDVVGPAASTDGNLAVFSGVTGKLLKDTSGKLAVDVVVGPSASVTDELTLFSGTGGKTLKRCGLVGFVKAASSGAATAQTQMGAADIGTAAITGQTAKTSIASADQFLMYDSVGLALKKVAGNLVQRFPRGHLAGLKVSNNATDAVNDIDIAVGECRSDDDTEDMVLGTALTKRVDAAWVAGTNQGGRDTGSLADTTYHLFLIKNVTTGTVDALFSASISSPTMPGGYSVKRRLLSFKRNTTSFGGNWQFKQQPNDYFQTVTYIDDLSAGPASPSTNILLTVTTVPAGLKVLTHMNARLTNTTGAQSLGVYDPDVALGTGPSAVWTQSANVNIASEVFVWSDVSAQHRYTTGGGGGTTSWTMVVLGFWDPRGRDT
jgi:hypothetical protein